VSTPVPERQTVWYFAAARHDGGGGGASVSFGSLLAQDRIRTGSKVLTCDTTRLGGL